MGEVGDQDKRNDRVPTRTCSWRTTLMASLSSWLRRRSAKSMYLTRSTTSRRYGEHVRTACHTLTQRRGHESDTLIPRGSLA